MKPELYKEVALVREVPEEGLCIGDVAMLIDYIPHPAGGEEGLCLNFLMRSGNPSP